MSLFNNIITTSNKIIGTCPYKNFKNTKSFLNKINNIDIEKYKILLEKKKKTYGHYSRIQLGETYINKKHNYTLELFLLKWDKNSMTKIHNHSTYGCTMKIIEGSLKEYIYKNDMTFSHNNIYNKNDVSYINNTIGYHRILNLNDKPSYSLHMYCDRLNKHTEIKYFGVW